jgi:translocation and assembly module TamB
MSSGEKTTQTSQQTPLTWGARLIRIAAIAVALLMILLVAVLALISALVGTNSGSAWVLHFGLAQLQSETREASFEQSQGTLLSGLRIQQLRYRDGENLVTVASLQSNWNPMSLFSGKFIVDQLVLDGVDLHWHSAPQPEISEPVSADLFAGILPLPLDISLTRFALRNASLAFDEMAYSIDSLTLAAQLTQRHLRLGNLQFAAPPVQVSGVIEADLQEAIPLKVDLSWRFSGPLLEDIEDASGALRLEGDLNRFRLNHELTTPAQITSRGMFDLNLFNDATTEQRFELTHSIDPQVLSSAGLAGGRRLRIDSAQIVTEGSFAAVQFSGDARVTLEDPQGGIIVPPLDLQWATGWQGQSLAIETLMVASATGHIAANGILDWQDFFGLDIHVDVEEQDGAQYQPLLPEGLIIGALTGSADLQMQQSDNGFAGAVRIDNLSGELNNYPLSAQGNLVYGQDGLHVDDLHAASGSTTLSLNGNWADSIDLNWEIDASDIGTLSPMLSGSIDATGTLRGTPEAPQINLDASGNNLDFAGTRVASFSAKGEYLSNRNIVEINALGIETSGESPQRIDSVAISALGTPADHQLTLAVRAPLGEFDLELRGAVQFEDPLQWTGSMRNGRILSDLGQWQLEGEPTLTASAQSATVSSQCWLQEQTRLCLDADWASTGAIAANAQLNNYPLSHFNPPSPGEKSAALGAVLLPQLPEGSRAEGSLNAQFSATGLLSEDPAALNLRFNVDAGEGMIHVEPTLAAADELTSVETDPPEAQTFNWRNAQLAGSRIDNMWQITSTLDFYQPNLADSGMSVQGNADAQLTVDSDQALDGRVDLAFDDLSWIEAFLPTLQNTQGQLQGLTLISGSIAAPRFGGNLALTNASVDIPGLGLELRDITTNVTSDINQTVEIQGQATSGDGTLQFFSEIIAPMSPQRSFEIDINGDNFTVANDAEILLKISPDLQVNGNSNSLNITGTLNLPVVDIQLTELPESAIDVSTDTVIVDNGPQTPAVHNAALADRGILGAMSITAEVAIKLGDEVRFRGFGLEAQLAGALDITQRATGAPLTYGELTVVEGFYATYGRRLDIEHGKLLFFGSMDNPALDIRAIRQTESIKAGVQMNGTLRNIRSQLFSTPTLPDSDILAVLITGKPFAEMGNQDSNALAGAITTLGINQGKSFTNEVRSQLGLDTLAINSTGDTSNSSLTLGKYLTPKIFIRYGVGLFDTESTLSVDYSVSDRVKLEAKSGSSQSVDIKYTVER